MGYATNAQWTVWNLKPHNYLRMRNNVSSNASKEEIWQLTPI
jgi:hypothetical protein